MARGNSGLLGPVRSTFSGIWSISEQQRKRGNGEWVLGYRYFRYVIGSAVASHHPRVSRYVLTLNGVDTTISTVTSDNCADSGNIDAQGTIITFDATTEKNVTAAKCYSSYGGGLRSANYSVQVSTNNSTWITAFSGVMAANSQCGIITGTIV
jgi:hypothetical protein